MKTTKIYVGNLPDGCTTDELKAVFEEYGKVAECDIVKNYGFVHMSSDQEAQRAISALHGTEIRNAKISVEASHSKVRQKPGMGGKGQCYRCGKSGHWSKDCPRNDRNRRDNNRDNRESQTSYRIHNSYQDSGYSKNNSSSAHDSFGPIRRTTTTTSSDCRVWARPYPEPYQRVTSNNYIPNSSNISVSHQQSSYAPFVAAHTSLQPNYSLNQNQPLVPGHQATHTLGLMQPNYVQTQRAQLQNSHLHPQNQFPMQHQPNIYQTQAQPTLPSQIPLQARTSTSAMNRYEWCFY